MNVSRDIGFIVTIQPILPSPKDFWRAIAQIRTLPKSGVSALGLQRLLGLGSYETAWMMLQKLRRAMVRPLSAFSPCTGAYKPQKLPNKQTSGA